MVEYMNKIDVLITKADATLRAIFPPHSPTAKIVSPATNIPETQLSETERRHAARLMRVNHAGEFCAQALYLGQNIFERDPQTKEILLNAAKEEQNHLDWCHERLQQLNSTPSRLNPLWYAMSMVSGAVAGLAGRKFGLGFIAATEEEVCRHLDNHLQLLPENDRKSRAILTQMRADEDAHKTKAIDSGGMVFATPIKYSMRIISRVMTKSSYYL